MTVEINQLIETAKLEQAVEYAKFEIQQHEHRVTNKARSELARYNLSTPTKMRVSTLMFLAWQEREYIPASDAAKKLHISRQSADSILKECLDAGWVKCCFKGYRYTDECAAHYIDAIDEMVVSLSTSLSEKIEKLISLREILSSHLSLTERQDDIILRTGGEHRETK